LQFNTKEYLDKVKKAASFIKEKIGSDIYDVAIIFGSGLSPFYDFNKISSILYEEIPFFPISSIKGHEGRLTLTECYGKKIINFLGRFHYYEGYTPFEVTFPVRVIKELAVKTLIITNAAGSLNKKIKVGDLMIINDHINLTGTNPLIGPNIEEHGSRFIDMSKAYSPRLINLVKKYARYKNIKHGVYVGVDGPTYETKSEIKYFKKIGGDAVGMSTIFETVVATHCAIETIGISCIVNSALNFNKHTISHESVINEAKIIEPSLMRLIDVIIKNL
jgi:purine-nucleoside phosphorylase